MIKPQDGWWYSVVAAAPDPEVGDTVNIALVTGRGTTHGDLEFMADLPKLACLVGPGETALFTSVLKELARRVERGEPLDMLRGTFGPQLRISDPRQLLHAPNERTRRNLRQKYLENQRSRMRREARGRSGAKEARKKLDDLLVPRLPVVRIGYVRTVTPEALYPGGDDFFGTAVPKLDRALTTDRRDLLVGGVVVNRHRSLQHVRHNAGRLSHAFWQYDSARDQVRQSFGKEIRLLGVIIAEDDSSQALEGLELAKHVLGQDADTVATSGRHGFAEKLDSEINWVVS